MNSAKHLVRTFAFSTATALSFAVYAQTGLSTLDKAAAVLQAGENHGRDQDRSFRHRLPAIVGMWITTFYIGPFKGPDTPKVDIAIQQYSSDGHELMNSSSFPPTAGNVCFGVWKDLGHGTFKLRHIGFAFNATTGAFEGIALINATFTVSEDGNSFAGTHSGPILDLEGNELPGSFVEGDIRATRFEVDGTDIARQIMANEVSVKPLSLGSMARRKAC